MSNMELTKKLMEKANEEAEKGQDISLTMLVPISISLASIADSLENIHTTLERIRRYGIR